MTGRPALLRLRFLTDFRSFRVMPLVLVHPDLQSFNPSIAAQGGTIVFCMRHSNVLTAGNRKLFGFTSKIAGNGHDVVNDSSFGSLRIPEWGEALDSTLFEARAPGFEDIRIFEHGGRWFGLGCKPETQSPGGTTTFTGSTMHLIAFERNFRFGGAMALPSPSASVWEKNWVPFLHRDGLRVVYRPSPFSVFSLDFEGRRIVPVHQGAGPSRDWSDGGVPWTGLSGIPWSGSSQILPYEANTYLGVIHRKFVFCEEYVFEHAFIRINEAFETEISQTFHFLSYGEEFCAGLVVREKDVVLSFGSHNDSRGYVATLAREDVAALFRPHPGP